MNAFFDGYVGPKTTLKQFVDQYDEALKSKVEKENTEDFISLTSRVPCITHLKMKWRYNAIVAYLNLEESSASMPFLCS